MKRKPIGAIMILCASLFSFICALIFHFDFSIAVVITTVLDVIGLCLLSSSMTDRIELIPERRYKLIHYSEEGSEKGMVIYSTLKYQNIYGVSKIHTFINVSYNQTDLPVVGRVYTACADRLSEGIFLKYRVEE